MGTPQRDYEVEVARAEAKFRATMDRAFQEANPNDLEKIMLHARDEKDRAIDEAANRYRRAAGDPG